MKVRYLIVAVSLILLASCTSTKNTGGTRWYHSFNTRYNVFFNGNEAFKEAYKSQLENHQENYSEMILMFPVSALPKEKAQPGGPFNKSIEKAVKAIKMHSIQTKPERKQGKGNDPKYREFMSRTEYNPFLHNAWMMMAQSQFYNGDFIEAASSFSYISRLYETQPEIAIIAKIWKARCYSEMGWYYEADDILSKIDKKLLTKKQNDWFSTVYADYLIKQKQYMEAIPYLQNAIKSEKNKYQRNREKYLLGQIYAATGQNDLAYKIFGEVAGSTVPYILQLSAAIRQTEVYPGGNIKKMSKKLEGMAKSSKNKEYLDQIYYALGNIYMTVPDTAKAIESYELGVEKSTQGGIAKAMNQIKLGDIYFSLRKYVEAQPNYSESLTQLKKEDEAYPRVSKRSEVLDALVTHFEAVQLQDSLLRLSQMTNEERLTVVKKIIADLIKKEEEEKKKATMDEYLAKQEDLRAQRQTNVKQPKTPMTPVMPGPASSEGAFYFYNQQAVALGKNAFQQKWGRRKLEDNWRLRNKANTLSDTSGEENLAMATDSLENKESELPIDSAQSIADKGDVQLTNDPKDPQYYLQQIPETEEDIAAANLIIADGLFNMAVIYKDLLEDDNLALETFDELNTRYPENENKLDAYHHIYLIYWKRGDMASAELYKSKIREEFPESDLALAMADPNYEYNQKMMNVIQDSLYENVYNNYLTGNHLAIRQIYKEVSTKYNQSKLMPKFMFLNALSFVQTNEPDTFKVLLKQLIEKYPTEDVSVLSGEIMKGFQRGLLLGTGDNSLARSGLFNMRFGSAGEIVSDSVLVFTDSIKMPHKLLLIYPKGSLNENILLYTVANFNFGNFMVNDFGLQKTNINNEVSMLEISGFNNLPEVMQYFRMINQPKGYMKDLNQTVVPVPISDSNYKTLMKGKSLSDYMLFFEEHFGEGNEVLIEQWKSDQEKDKIRIEKKAKAEEEASQKAAKVIEESKKETPVVETNPLDSIPVIALDSVKPQDNTTDKYDEAINEVYNEATEKIDNLEKTYNEITSDPIRGILNLFKKKSTTSNAIDEYAKQKEKEEKELAKQQKKEQAEKDKIDRELAKQKEKEQQEALKKQKAETDSILKVQKKQAEDSIKLKVNEKKQQEADKKLAAKEKEDARKTAAQLKKDQQKEKEKQRKLDQAEKAKKQKEQQKIKEQERKAKDAARKEAQKEKEKARAEALKQKEAERKAKKK